ncbi:MAG: leucyl aminopeptidase family protein [Planctomycetes bacterium]|nr:leucyl aminopeptidase family protein [Planctomycetota bacterium]
MLDCIIDAKPIKKPDLTVVIVGHSAAKLPKLIEAQAARMAKGNGGGPSNMITADGRYLLLKPDEKAWLVGGENWRLLGRDIADALRSGKLESALVLAHGRSANVQALVEGIALGDYRFNLCRSGKESKRSRIEVHIPGHGPAIEAGLLTSGAQNLARELADTPPNLLNPQTFAARARAELSGTGIDVRITSGANALRKAGFPGLAQVGMAGSAEPCLVEMHYKPGKKRKSKKDVRLALVGKGITFDSGGISLKPGDKMWEMKGDMSGAAAVLGAMSWIAEHEPGIPISGYLCLAENMPDRTAQRPGDIYQARNGKWIHVDNTDAEGRLVLSDVLTYAGERGATHIVDVATLTGACMVALGDRMGGLMGRGDAFLQSVRAAGQEAGEEFWQLPLYGEYRSLLDHPHADLNNIGGRFAGAITAGIFLSEFVPENTQWAHLDIAGPAIQSGGWRYYAKGMTGFATRTLIRLAQKLG